MPNTSTDKTQSDKSKKGPPPVKCDKFDASRYSYTELETDNERNKAQMIAYPRYNYPKQGDNAFVFQTDWIQLTQYGLPKKGSKAGDFYMNDSDRTFLKIPLDPTQDSCVHLRNMLTEVDNYNVKNTDKIFKNLGMKSGSTGSKTGKLFTYQKSVRTPQESDELGEINENSKKGGHNDKKAEKFDYCKMQFSTSYPDKNILTKSFIRESLDKPEVRECKPSTVSDLEDEGLGWGATIRMIVMVNKLWAAKAKNPQTGMRGYGVTMKIMQLEVIPRERSSSVKESFTKYAFNDGGDEDEESEEEQTPSKNTKGTKKVETVEESEEEKNADADVEDGEASGEEEDGGDEEGEGSESAEEEPVKTKGKKAAPAPSSKKSTKSRTSNART